MSAERLCSRCDAEATNGRLCAYHFAEYRYTPSEPKSDAQRMKEHVRGCEECSAGNFCDEGESYGGAVTSDYLYRITVANGCRPEAVARAIAARRAPSEGAETLREAAQRFLVAFEASGIILDRETPSDVPLIAAIAALRAALRGEGA